MATMYYRPYSSEPIKDGELPPHDALENILPEYKYIFMDPHQPSGSRAPRNQVARLSDSPVSQPLEDIPSGRMFEYQMQELEKYRLAVRTMGQDIITLRQQIRELEIENSQLRSKINGYGDATRLILDSEELSSLAKDDIANRYATLKRKLNDQTSELREYKERVRDLQNQLIKKNDREREFLKLSVAHEGQQDLLHKLQEKANKVKKLEEACRKQEKVIERMEKLLDNNRPQQPSREDSSLKEANAALVEENRRLRFEVNEVLSNPGRNSRQEQDSEKLNLLERLDRAEGRIMSLEKQLSDNAKSWAREKSDMKTRLRDAEFGLMKPLSPVYNSYPKMKPHTQDDLWDEPWSKSSPRRSYPGKGKGPPLRY